MKRCVSFFLVLLALVMLTVSADAKPAKKASQPLFRVPFTHVAHNESLSVLLAEFARTQGYAAVVSPALQGKVDGSFESTNPYEFLASMGAAYQVRWFYQGRTINFYSQNEMQQAFLTPSVIKASTLLSLFRETGLLSPQLPHKLLKDKNILYVSAPGFYINQLRQAMTSMEQAQRNRITMRVFPLKNAWAEDKQVTSSNDTLVTVPGVASILRSMLMGGNAVTTVTRTPAVQSGLLGSGLAAGKPHEGKEGKGDGEKNASSSTDQASQVNIIADPRVNAVVVTDAEYRMEYYARVIADLDKPVRLVEIHAAIVDIDSNFQRELGINFQGSAAMGNGWSLGGAEGAAVSEGTLPARGAASSAGLSFSTLYTRSTDFFLTRVRALEEDGVARMLGKPSVLTTDNMQATLENTNTYYIPVSGYQATDLFKVETGTVLKVTPHIIPGRVLPDGTKLPDAIKLIVTIQDNRNDSNTSFTVSSTSPQPLRQTKINTQAIVNEGQSLLIAGYYQEKQEDTDSGVPAIKNVPLLGRLFSSDKQAHARMERLVLITPRILSIEDTPVVPKRVEDPRFSRTATAANYDERVPEKPVIGGCTRRRLDYASTPDVPPKPNMPEHPVPMGEPAQPLTGTESPAASAPGLPPKPNIPENPVPAGKPVQPLTGTKSP